MEISLPVELEAFVQAKVRSGRYADPSDVIRTALRQMESQGEYESPALEAALLEGIRSPHQPYSKATLDRVRSNARTGK